MKSNIYDKFKCIADKCPITCCQEWKIYVDDDTNEKWSKYPAIHEQVMEKEGQRMLSLDEKHACPFLDKNKLCKLVIEHGDKMLSHTCQIFPRQHKEIAGVVEKSLVTCCPCVVDMLWQEELRFDDEAAVYETVDDELRLLLAVRKHMLDMLAKGTYSVQKTLLMCFYLLLELRDELDNTDEEKLIKSLPSRFSEYSLKRLADTIDDMEFDICDTMIERNELFLDLAQNYREEGIYTSYLEAIAKEAETLSEAVEEADEEFLDELADSSEDFMDELAQYDRLFEQYIMSEIFTSGLHEDSIINDMIIAVQWLAMEYATIQQAVYLKWRMDGEDDLAYETIRDYMTIVSRMTGYDEDDIVEYMENSFEDVIWEWGYFALLVGNREE